MQNIFFMSRAVTIIACCLPCLYGMGAAAQPLYPLEVAGEMKSPRVVYALNTCGELDPGLLSVKLTVVIYKNGRMRLAGTEPDASEDLDLCLRKVISRIRMPESGSKHKMKYNVVFKKWAPEGMMDGRPESSGPGSLPWNHQHSQGKKLLIPGLLFTFLGCAPMAYLTSAFIVVEMWDEIFPEWNDHLPDRTTGLALTLSGMALFLLGQALTIVGSKKCRDAKKMKKDFYVSSFMLIPSPLENGAMLSAVLRF